MEREKKTESPMLKLARFIVDKRKAFYLIFLASFLFCAVSISKVHVNDDITTYLPAHTETRRGLTLMDEEFITLGSANIMVSNITYDAAYALSLKIEKLPASPLWSLTIPRSTTTIPQPCSPFPSTVRRMTRTPPLSFSRWSSFWTATTTIPPPPLAGTSRPASSRR